MPDPTMVEPIPTPRGHTFDNRHIVPYNPFCLQSMTVTSTSRSVPPSRPSSTFTSMSTRVMTVQPWRSDIDEIMDHMNSRYIGPVAGVWHAMEFPMHEEKPSVYRLPVHLIDQHMVYFNDDDNPEEVLDREPAKKTPLTEWFTCQWTLEGAKDVTYQTFPKISLGTRKQGSGTYAAMPCHRKDVLCPSLCWRTLLSQDPLDHVSKVQSLGRISEHFKGGCIQPSKLPVLPVVFWRMMENGRNVCKRPETCRQDINFATFCHPPY
jgi:hypothetical protein